MGLDITAYRKLTAVRQLTQKEIEWGEPEDGSITLRHFNPHYPEQQKPFEETPTAFTAEDEMGFRAGSYGGYNAWRNELARMAGYGRAETAWAGETNSNGRRPFIELIHFSDCEGIIGWPVAAKLAGEFAECQSIAETHICEDPSDGQWFRDLYAEWRRAFEMAADGGAVEFH